MSERKRLYIAVHGPEDWRIIRTATEPTHSEHGAAGDALYCIGPFRTLRGARFAVETRGGVIFQTVGEWERYAPRA